ncbi:MAG: FAD-dependent oxidoreductase [Planctomycetota bacterium]
MRSSRIVLIGGGHTHALVLHALRSARIDNASVTLINPSRTAPYSGMLPGFVAGHYERDELEINLERLTRQAGAELIQGRAVALRQSPQRVLLEDGKELTFDLASLDVGITSEMPHLKGFASFGIPVKPLATFAARWEQYRSFPGTKSIAVIGGGIAGAEIAMAMSFALRSRGIHGSIKLFDRGEILWASSRRTQRRLRGELVRNRVKLIERATIQRVTEAGVVLEDGETIEAEFVLGAAGATPHPWLGDSGLELHSGFVVVDTHLQSNISGLFAAGDCAHLAFDPRPKAGVFAVRQAPILLENLRRASTGRPLLAYQPQKDYLKIVSLGGKRAYAEKYGFGLSGDIMWRLKHHIDRRFMEQFREQSAKTQSEFE